jgi:Transposase DDE domain
LRAELHCPIVIAAYRQRPQDFTRRRRLPFAYVVLLILRGHKLSLQNALNKVFKALDKLLRVPQASAYCHARRKLKPEIFALLNRGICQNFYRLYEADGLVKRWRGHRLIAADGTYLNLPDTPETRTEFTLQTNQHAGAECVQALCCVLYDLRNDLGLSLSLSKRAGEVHRLIEQLWPATRPEDLLVLDRAYADYALIAYAVAHQRHLVIRLPRGRFAACEAFWHSQEKERRVELSVPATASTREFVKQHGLPETVTIRLIRVLLPTGETEVLLTTLLDEQAYPAAEFAQVYNWRWGEETYFDRFKNVFEVERLSGTSVIAIKQEIYGVLMLTSLESVLAKPDQQALEAQAAERQTRYVPQVNRAESYVALVDRVVPLLLSEQPQEKILEELHHLFRQNPTLQRPGRQVDRKPLKYAHRLRFQKYVKKLLV